MQITDLTDFIAANQNRLVPLLSYTLAVSGLTWAGFFFLHQRAGSLRSQEVKNAERLAAVYKAQLDEAKERLKELTPQSQATDLAGLLDDLTRKLTATAEAGEALLPNRLVHIAQEADGRSVVLLADKIKQLEAHGFVIRTYAKGEEVRIERLGQFPLPFVPTGRRLFLGTEGQVSENVDMIPNTILQRVGMRGANGICLFKPEEESHVE